MEDASVDLVNRLVAYLRKSGNTDKIYFSAASKERKGHAVLVNEPRLCIEPIYRNGVLELIWPRLKSALDADYILQSGMWVAIAYGLIGWLGYVMHGRPISGLIVAAFFIFGGLNLRTGSLGAIAGIFSFFAFTCLCVLTSGPTFSLGCLALSPVLLIGSAKAAQFLHRNHPASLLRSIALTILGISAALAGLVGTVLTLYPMETDNSMEPNLRAGDWVVSLNAPLIGPVHRGEIVAFPYWNWIGPKRVVGLPGDRIQVRSGKLIRNGSAVPEPYSRQPYRSDLGDFPLPSEAYPDDSTRWEHNHAYGNTLTVGTPFVVPPGSCFLLNDDRNELSDSRIFGPLPSINISGTPLLVYDGHENIPSRLRLVR
jgi:signal peptidase I